MLNKLLTPRSLSPVDWDRATVTVRVGSERAPSRLNAGILREKSHFFASFLTNNWDESVELSLDSIEPREFKIYKDWLYKR